jgi:hypothetical protein
VNKNMKKAAVMVDLVPLGFMNLLFADAVPACSACRAAWIAHDGFIVATLNRVDTVVAPTDTALEKQDRLAVPTGACLVPS